MTSTTGGSTTSGLPPTGPGIFIATDPDQEKRGHYKVSKTVNIVTTMVQLNAARANRDFKLVHFSPCADLKKAEDFVKPAMKKKYIANSTEWIKADDEQALAKIVSTVESLVAIVNDA